MTQAGDTARPRATPPRVTKTVANRAADNLDQINNVIGGWYRYYDGYDPMFGWWMKDPYRKLDDALTSYARALRERVVGFRPATAQVAASRGGGGGRGGAGGGGGRAAAAAVAAVAATRTTTARSSATRSAIEGLKADLDHEMIPYTPEELIAIAEREYAFSLSEAKKAAREMGLRRRLEGGDGEGEEHATSSRASSRSSFAISHDRPRRSSTRTIG